MSPADKPIKIHYSTIWLSDVHLGYRQCRAAFVLDFLDTLSCNRLYLVGDVIDMWVLGLSFYWSKVSQGTSE